MDIDPSDGCLHDSLFDDSVQLQATKLSRSGSRTGRRACDSATRKGYLYQSDANARASYAANAAAATGRYSTGTSRTFGPATNSRAASRANQNTVGSIIASAH
jgi:hypothetical protein